MSTAIPSNVQRPPCSDPLRRTLRPSRLRSRQFVRRPCGEGAATSPLTNVTRVRPWGRRVPLVAKRLARGEGGVSISTSNASETGCNPRLYRKYSFSRVREEGFNDC